MTNLVIKKRIPLLYYVLVIFLVLFTAKPIPDLDVNFNGISSWLFLGLTILVVISQKVTIDKNFIWITVGLLLVNLITVFKYQEFYPRFFLIYLFSFFYAYVTLKVLKKDFFEVFEKTVFFWSVFIILPLYIFSLISPVGIRSLIMSIPFSYDHNQVYESRVYSFIYCFMTDNRFRNSGFGWEPGIFASILIVAMMINLINNKFKFNVKFWLFSVVLFTTFSTTGYILFGVLLLWVFINRFLKKSYGVILLPVFILALVIIGRSEVISMKFNYSMKEAKKTELLLKEAKSEKDTYVHAQRIASFLITLKDIKENPVFGTLGNFDDRWYIKKYGKLSNFRAISGIGTFLTIFGFTGLFIFLVVSWKSMKVLEFEYQFKNAFFIILIILIISVSYYIYDSAMFFTFIFYYYLKENLFHSLKRSKLDQQKIRQLFNESQVSKNINHN